MVGVAEAHPVGLVQLHLVTFQVWVMLGGSVRVEVVRTAQLHSSLPTGPHTTPPCPRDACLKLLLLLEARNMMPEAAPVHPMRLA